jgi:hypothetical protein
VVITLFLLVEVKAINQQISIGLINKKSHDVVTIDALASALQEVIGQIV